MRRIRSDTARSCTFWTLATAILIFAVGGGMSFYEGITHILNPVPLTDATWNYIVITAAMLFEGGSWCVAYRAFRRTKRHRGLLGSLHATKDPSLMTVLLEDSAALIGLVIALAGVALGHWLDNPYLDGSASLAIGVLLATVAVAFAYESKGLLVGEAMLPEELAAIRSLIEADPAVPRPSARCRCTFGPHGVCSTWISASATGCDRRTERRHRPDRGGHLPRSSRYSAHLHRNGIANVEAPCHGRPGELPSSSRQRR